MRPPPGAGVANTGRCWPLGQRDDHVPGTGGVDLGAGDQHRVRRRFQPAGEVVDRLRVADGAAVVRRSIAARRRHRRPRRPNSPSGSRRRSVPGWQRGELRRAPEGERHVLRARGLVAPLDQRVRQPGHVAVGQVRLQRDKRARLLAGGHHERRVVGLRVEDRAHGVAHARRGVEVDERRAAPGLGVAVGHADDDRLLEPEDVAEIVRVVAQHRQLGRARVAEHGRHPVRAEDVGGGLADAGRSRRTLRLCRYSRYGGIFRSGFDHATGAPGARPGAAVRPARAADAGRASAGGGGAARALQRARRPLRPPRPHGRDHGHDHLRLARRRRSRHPSRPRDARAGERRARPPTSVPTRPALRTAPTIPSCCSGSCSPCSTPRSSSTGATSARSTAGTRPHCGVTTGWSAGCSAGPGPDAAHARRRRCLSRAHARG